MIDFDAPFYLVLRIYKIAAFFKVNNEISEICKVNAGTPQGNVLYPAFYTIFSPYMPLAVDITVTTCVDDTVVIERGKRKTGASTLVQTYSESD